MEHSCQALMQSWIMSNVVIAIVGKCRSLLAGEGEQASSLLDRLLFASLITCFSQFSHTALTLALDSSSS